MTSMVHSVVVVFCGLILPLGAQAETNSSGEKQVVSSGAKVITIFLNQGQQFNSRNCFRLHGSSAGKVVLKTIPTVP